MEPSICPIVLLALCLTLYLLTFLQQLFVSRCKNSPYSFIVGPIVIKGHVTSSVTWPLEPQLVLSYWCSVDAKSLSRMVDTHHNLDNYIPTVNTLKTNLRDFFCGGGDRRLCHFSV